MVFVTAAIFKTCFHYVNYFSNDQHMDDQHGKGEQESLETEGSFLSEKDIRALNDQPSPDYLMEGEVPSNGKNSHSMPEGSIKEIDEQGRISVL